MARPKGSKNKKKKAPNHTSAFSTVHVWIQEYVILRRLSHTPRGMVPPFLYALEGLVQFFPEQLAGLEMGLLSGWNVDDLAGPGVSGCGLGFGLLHLKNAESPYLYPIPLDQALPHGGEYAVDHSCGEVLLASRALADFQRQIPLGCGHHQLLWIDGGECQRRTVRSRRPFLGAISKLRIILGLNKVIYWMGRVKKKLRSMVRKPAS